MHNGDYKLEQINSHVAYVIAGNEVVGAVKKLVCGHVEFRFSTCQILFHLHVQPIEREKIFDCVDALAKLNFEHSDAPAMSVPFHHEQCRLDQIMEFKKELLILIEAAKDLIKKIANGEPKSINDFVNPHRPVHPRAKTDDVNDAMMRQILNHQDNGKHDESKMARTRPMNSTESILGFIEFILSDSSKNHGMDDDALSAMREDLSTLLAYYAEKNNLPMARPGWKDSVNGI